MADIEALLRGAESEEDEARRQLDEGGYRLSDAQARAILALQLSRLTGLEREKLTSELEELKRRMLELLRILRSRERLLEVMREELLSFRRAVRHPAPHRDRPRGRARRRHRGADPARGHGRYRHPQGLDQARPALDLPLTTARREGPGRHARRLKDDFVASLFVANTHTPVLFFSSLGRVYKLKVYKLPLGNPQARGRAMINLFPSLAEGETITAVMPLPEDETQWEGMSAFFATARGRVRRSELADFVRVPANGKIGMGLDEGDRLVGVEVCGDGHDIILAAAGGRAIRFPVASLRVIKSRASEGVNGMDLAEGDRVISMSVVDHVEVTIDDATSSCASAAPPVASRRARTATRRARRSCGP